MRIENAFDVPASVEESWRLLNDVPAVVPCMPGAELVEVVGDDAWKAKLHVKLGPIALQFLADVTREQSDEAANRVVLAVKAREVKGRGSAKATIESSLAPAGEGTHVALVTELALRGGVAQYGRGRRIAADRSVRRVRRGQARVDAGGAARAAARGEAEAGPRQWAPPRLRRALALAVQRRG
jgi:uncharacterized protein